MKNQYPYILKPYAGSSRRRKAGRVRLAIMMATLALFILPFFVVTNTTGTVRDWIANRAMASTESGVDTETGLRYSLRQDQKAQKIRSMVARQPQAMLKLKDSEIELAFSRPQLMRKEGPVRIWQYRNRDCVLDIYFQDDRQPVDSTRVSYYEFRARDKAVLIPGDKARSEAPDTKSCVQALIDKDKGQRSARFASLVP